MTISKYGLAAAAVISFPLLAQAQPVTGLYVGGGIGGNYLEKTDITGTWRSNKTIIQGESVEFDWGFGGVLSLGWGYGNGLRAEVEASYRLNEVSGHTVFWQNKPGATGRAYSYGVMGNILYDFDLGGALGGISPYLGFGAGYIWHQYSDVGYRVNRQDDNTYQGTAGAPAGQLIAGVSLPIASVPGLSLTAEYRYLKTSGHNFGRNTVNGIIYPADADVDNTNQSILFGVRYAFNAGPSVVAAAPVAAARTYLVFFDWSKADLTDRARQVIGEAASNRGQGVTRIEVNGFTDRSGPADYNMQLSIRRANAVAAELMRRGVPRNEIVTRGFGEENNLVPTADGVREPQNRRVEIILR
jgi:outer membrane protein OmpA-like peptidoglycan-associated protein